MKAIFNLNIEELDADLLNSLKLAFKGKQIEITIREIGESETQYLLSTEANRLHLEKAMEDLAAGQGIKFNTEDFLKEYRDKIILIEKQTGNKDISIYEDEDDI